MKLVGVIKMCPNETYSRVCADKYFSGTFPTKNGLTQGNALLPLFLNFALEYAIRKFQTNKWSLKLNGTHQLLVYADDVNILRRSTHTTKRNTEAAVVASKDTDLQ